MDPRIKTSPADRRKQFRMGERFIEGMNESFEALDAGSAISALQRRSVRQAGKGASGRRDRCSR